ncbi:hypothetical protein DE146DRAFT_733956 [Phaeosphaeria sp. MPI-PUGE-AT-0046c]|nr:hypothetical protein DE146DRAFT_733956 [Phaeosphaeria sp. MPI-PUGE-AT-0046c]
MYPTRILVSSSIDRSYVLTRIRMHMWDKTCLDYPVWACPRAPLHIDYSRPRRRMIARVLFVHSHAKLADALHVLSYPQRRRRKKRGHNSLGTYRYCSSGVGDGAWSTAPHAARSRASPYHVDCTSARQSLPRSARDWDQTFLVLGIVALVTRCGRRRLHTHSTRRNRPYPGFVLISNKGASRDERGWPHVFASSWYNSGTIPFSHVAVAKSFPESDSTPLAHTLTHGLLVVMAAGCRREGDRGSEIRLVCMVYAAGSHPVHVLGYIQAMAVDRVYHVFLRRSHAAIRFLNSRKAGGAQDRRTQIQALKLLMSILAVVILPNHGPG